MKISADRYGYRSSSYYESRSTSNQHYSKILTDDFENLSYVGSELSQLTPHDSSPVCSGGDNCTSYEKTKSNQPQQFLPTEYINLDEENMRSYYDEKYYLSYRKSDIVGELDSGNANKTIKKVPCYLLSNFCIVRKFAVVELDAFGYSSNQDCGSFYNFDKSCENNYETNYETNSETSAGGDVKEYSLMMHLRMMEFANPNCANYYTMVKQRYPANDFEKNYLIDKLVGGHPSPNLETYDLFITGDEIRKSDMIQKTTSKSLDKPVTIYFTPELNTEYVSFRIRNHLKTYVLFDLRKNTVYLTGETSAIARNYSTTRTYSKKIEIY